MQLPKKNWLEWTVFALSLVLVIGVIGFLTLSALTDQKRPPALEIVVGTPQQQQNGYIVPITVQNNGDETAEGVQIEVQLLRDGEELERGEFELAFVPRQSSAGGWVTFQEDPQSAQIEARVLGFEQP